MSYQGQVWHLPLQVDPNFPFFWNKATLRQAGLNPDRAPATVDELDQAAQTLNREAGGQWERVGFVPWSWYGTGNSVVTAAYAFGGSFYDRDRDRATFNHPQVVRAVEWMAGWGQRLDVDRITQMFSGTNAVRLLAAAGWPSTPWSASTSPPRGERRRRAGLRAPAGPPGAGRRRLDGRLAHAAVSGASARRRPGGSCAGWGPAMKAPSPSPATWAASLVTPGPPWTCWPRTRTRRPTWTPSGGPGSRTGFYLPVAVDYAPLADALSGKRSARDVLDEMTEQTQLKLEQFRAQPGAIRNPSWGGSLWVRGRRRGWWPTASAPGREGTTRTMASSSPVARRRKARGPPPGAEVAGGAEQVVRTGVRQLVRRGPRVAPGLQVAQHLVEAHAGEVGPVAVGLGDPERPGRSPGWPGPARLAAPRLRRRTSGCTPSPAPRPVTVGAGAALFQAPPAPGDLLGGAPVEAGAVRGLPGQAQHPGPEGAQVDRHPGGRNPSCARGVSVSPS